MKNVIVRSLSGIVYVGVMVGAVLAGGVWLALLLSVLACLGINEFNIITKETKYPRLTGSIDIASGILIVLSSCFFFSGHVKTAGSLMFTTLILYVARLVGQIYARQGNGINALARSMMAQLYIAIPLALIAMLYYSLATPHLVLALLIFIWVSDTGAFCVGSRIGRHKLFERISPKKTWEGFWGGMLFCVAAAFAMRGCFGKYYPGISYGDMCRLGILVSIFATFGDLLESMIKRTVSVKDSGNLIPGHGGILDRIDSLLLVAPVAVIYFLMIH